MGMKFSVIIPVYNAQKYLHECIDSVLGQTYSDFEIILVNDGSSDSSGEICDKYQRENPGRICVIHSENKGALIARTTGIKQAEGEVLLFLDSDDKFRCDTLELLNGAMESTGCDLVVFNGSCSEKYDIPFRAYPFEDGAVFTADEKEPVYRALVATGVLNNVCLKAVKKSVLDFDLGYSELPHMRHGEDLLMSAQMLTSAQKILIMNQVLYYYRDNAGSVTHSTQVGKADSIKAVHTFLEKLITQWGIPQLVHLHYGREVRGWVEVLHLLAREMEYKEYKKTAKKMANDPYFRNAYECGDMGKLSFREKLSASLLYKRKHRLFCLLNYLGVRK